MRSCASTTAFLRSACTGLSIGACWPLFTSRLECSCSIRALNDSDLGLGTRIGRTWTARVDWALPTRHSEISFRSRYVESEANSISTTAPAKPAYAVADIHLNTHPFGNPHVTLSLSVNNAFDRFYYDHSTYSFHAGTGKYIGFPDKGREFVLSAAYKF